MDRKLVTYVMLREPGATSLSTFGPGDTLPEWAYELVADKDHLFEAEDEDERLHAVREPVPSQRGPEKDYAEGAGKATEPAATEQGETQLVPVEGEDGDGAGDDEEPKGNASREAWALYAAEQGVPVTDEMGRDDIKAAVAEATK